MVLTVSFALSPGTGLSCPCHLADRNRKTWHQRRGVRTTRLRRPHRQRSSHAPARPPHPAPNGRDDREAPLWIEHGTARIMLLIWGRSQAIFRISETTMPATNWHDGQSEHASHALTMESIAPDDQLDRRAERKFGVTEEARHFCERAVTHLSGSSDDGIARRELAGPDALSTAASSVSVRSAVSGARLLAGICDRAIRSGNQGGNAFALSPARPGPSVRNVCSIVGSRE